MFVIKRKNKNEYFSRLKKDKFGNTVPVFRKMNMRFFDKLINVEFILKTHFQHYEVEILKFEQGELQ